MDDLNDLEKKIEHAKQAHDEPPETEPDNKNEGMRIASEFLSYVICGIFLGFMADKYIGTSPFGIIVMPVMGLVAGVYRANQAQNSSK